MLFHLYSLITIFLSYMESSFCVLHSIIILCYLVTLSQSVHSSTKPRCHDDERSALLRFKDSFLNANSCFIDDEHSKVESWKFLKGESGDCCSWDGVECDNQTNHVISLDLSDSCLFGSIKPNSTLFTLVHLKRLDLSNNDFSLSQIPSEIGKLSSLTHLDLSYSGFSGEIPQQLSNLSNIVSLDLSGNMDGPLLKLHKLGFGRLVQHFTNLKKLDLSDVDISSRVPDLMANLSSLESLYLSDCELNGEFPTTIFQLPKLKTLDLNYNPNLTVHLPDFQFSSLLESLVIQTSNFGGKIPTSIGNLIHLKELLIDGSINCNGQIPSSIGKLIHLKVLTISDCNITGQIPSSIGNLIHLKELVIEGSINCTVQIPSSIGNLIQLEELTIYHCNITSQIPSSIGNLTDLVLLSLLYNNFNPQSPATSSLSWIGKLTKLTSLHLAGINLSGAFPFWLMNLTQLAFLGMNHNQLTSPIPASLMNITHLEDVSFAYNQLSGIIPFQINHLSWLSTLDLSYNNLEGSLPSNLSNLNNLQFLNLQTNKLVGTVEFTIFFQLKKLRSLILSFNNLTLITNTITSNATIPNLRLLGLASCNIIEFPKFLHKQHQLDFLDLSSNHIRGQIPLWFCGMSQNDLEHLNLSHNHLTGFEKDPIVLQWVILRTLDLRSNLLQGSLPMPPSSTYFYLISHNKLSGEVSPAICDLSSLDTLDLSFNNLSGKLPQCLGNFSDSLSQLDLKRNNFQGSIPSTWRKGCKLRMISLSHNQLQGQLPRSLINCSFLEFIDFGSNQIVDNFPSRFGTLPELRILILRSNGFVGVLDEFGATGFSNLRVIDLSLNNFMGKLPSKLLDIWNAMKVINLSHMVYMEKSLTPDYPLIFSYYGEYDCSMTLYNKGLEMNYVKIPNIFIAIDFSYNKFEGEIPDIIGNLKGLQLLNLSGNNLNGHIPYSLANLKALECMDLSKNQLSGRIPMQLTKVTSLSSFDVSFNHLSGPIPQGNQFCTFDFNSYEGNLGLWMETWTKQCGNFKSMPQLQPPSFIEDEETSGSSIEVSWMIVSMGFASGLIVGVVAGNESAKRKQDWIANKFGRKQTKQRKRSRRNRA